MVVESFDERGGSRTQTEDACAALVRASEGAPRRQWSADQLGAMCPSHTPTTRVRPYLAPPPPHRHRPNLRRPGDKAPLRAPRQQGMSSVLYIIHPSRTHTA